MDLNVNVKVTIEASPTIVNLLDSWMAQLERQQGDYLNVLMDTVEERCQRERTEPVVMAVDELPAPCEAVPSKCEVVKAEEVPEPKGAEAVPESPAQNEKQAEPLTKDEEADLRKLASQFIRAGGDNRTVLKNWLEAKGFERVTAVTRDQLDELREVLKVA